MARLGDLQLHALGIDLNVQASSCQTSQLSSCLICVFSQNQLGQTLLHLAVVNGKVKENIQTFYMTTSL